MMAMQSKHSKASKPSKGSKGPKAVCGYVANSVCSFGSVHDQLICNLIGCAL